MLQHRHNLNNQKLPDMRPRMLMILAAAALMGSTGCLVGGKYSQPTLPNMPGQYAQPTSADTSALLSWFNLYGDTVLQRYIRTALDSNRNLLAAANRIEESREIAGLVRANLYPAFGYQLQAGGGQAGTDARRIGAGVDGGALRALGTLNWEIDLWGRIRNNNQAAYTRLLADVDNRNALVVSLVAEIASQYFLLRDLDNRLAVARRTLAVRQESARIIGERFAKGYVAEVDKLQADQQAGLAAAAIPAFERQIILVQNAIRTLMGLPPGPLERGDALFAQTVTPDIPAGLPSQLLQRRPDVREAERRLEAQFYSIGIARANLYPQFSLTGVLGFASPQLSSLVGGSGFVANGFAGLVGPIFQFGQNKRRVKVEEYRTRQLAYNYEQTVLRAMADVDNALAQYRTFNDEYRVRIELTQAARKSLELTRAKYDYGYSSYYEVLIQENYLFDAELAESVTFQQRLNALVQLYKALGGGWQ